MLNSDPSALLSQRFGPGAEACLVDVPGRVNLIGEHIDYHNLPVLPMAIQRRIRIAFRRRSDRRIRAISPHFDDCDFDWTDRLQPSASGSWVNYLKAAAQAVHDRWEVASGLDAAVISDLPPAAGLSSSSALLTGFVLALLRANGRSATFEELMNVLPEGEYFVGTRGGGMDHAAVLASRAGCALLINFAPLSVEPVPIPDGWGFLVAHSLTTAEKSNELRAEYNARRTGGTRALRQLGFASYAEAVSYLQEPLSHGRGSVAEQNRARQQTDLASRLPDRDRDCFFHVTREALRVRSAVAALKTSDAASFGALLNASHNSLRDLLRVSSPALDRLVEAALESGAMGARLTGAGFGGCAVIFCKRPDRDRIAEELVKRYYSQRTGFDSSAHLIAVEPSAGALCG